MALLKLNSIGKATSASKRIDNYFMMNMHRYAIREVKILQPFYNIQNQSVNITYPKRDPEFQ